METLPLDFRQGLADRLADHVAVADQALVGLVGEGEDVAGPLELGHETGRVAEHLRQALALGREPAFGQHALRGFDDDGDDAPRPAALVDDGRIVEVHPGLLGVARAVEDQFLVLVRQRAAGQAHLHDVVVEVGDLWPAFAHPAAEQRGMTAAGENGVGVVVDHDAVLAPQQDEIGTGEW